MVLLQELPRASIRLRPAGLIALLRRDLPQSHAMKPRLIHNHAHGSYRPLDGAAIPDFAITTPSLRPQVYLLVRQRRMHKELIRYGNTITDGLTHHLHAAASGEIRHQEYGHPGSIGICQVSSERRESVSNGGWPIATCSAKGVCRWICSLAQGHHGSGGVEANQRLCPASVVFLSSNGWDFKANR